MDERKKMARIIETIPMVKGENFRRGEIMNQCIKKLGIIDKSIIFL